MRQRLWSTVSTVALVSSVACAGTSPPVTTAPASVVAPAVPPAVPPTPPPGNTANFVPSIPKLDKVRTVEGITEYALDNGMQVLLFPDPTQSTVTVNITYLVGSRHEGYGETGMAHLLEHMMFKGTARYRNVLKLLDEKGAQSNGTTWTDRTNYYETLPASNDNLTFAIDMEADRMIHALISPDDLKTEFSVVRNEFEMGENDPAGVLGQRIIAAAYLWHNYGKDTIGSRSDIERVPVPALRAFYEKYYQPDNAVLVVSGKFDENLALKTIGEKFGRIPRPKRVLAPTYSVEPVQDGERQVVLRRNGDVHAVGVAYHTVGSASPDYPAVLAALDLLDREPSGRLYKKLVEPKLAASVSSHQTMFRDPYLAITFAEVRDAKNVDRVERVMIEQLESLGASKIDPKEVERWRAATLKELELAMADSEQVAIELSEFAALGDWRALFAFRDAIGKVTPDDVRRVAAAYFVRSNRTSGRFIPTKSEIRAPYVETPDITAFVKGIEGGTAKDQGEVFAATLENIEARTVRRTLAGGLTSAVLAKKTRGGKVELRLALHWGDEASLRGKEVIAQLTAAMLHRGTTKRSYQDLQDLENQLKAEISIGGAAQGFTLRIATLRDQLAPAVDLGIEMLRSPSFPARELELVKQEYLAALEQQLTDPSSIAWTTLAKDTTKWPKGDPRYTMSPAEEIAAVKAVTIADIKAFHRDVVGASHGELAVVGDVDPASITNQIEQRLSGWPSRAKYQRLADKAFGVAGATKSIDVKDKEMSQLVAGHDLVMRDTDPDYPAWLLLGHLLGGDTSSRLWMRLRENEGLSYGTGAWTDAGVLDDAASFGAYAIVAPQNVAKAKASILAEIERITTAKVSADELSRAKQGWLKGQDTNLSNDGYVTSMLARDLFHKRTTAETIALRKKLEAVTIEDVARVAKTRLDPKRLVIIDAGDQAKATAAPKP